MNLQGALLASVVISQLFGGGGGSSGPYRHDYVELFNAGDRPVDLGGWSLQYGSPTGDFASSSMNLFAFPAKTVLGPGRYLSVRLGSAGKSGVEPATDLSTGGLSMGAGSGKIALANVSTPLGCGATANACPADDPRIVDRVAYGVSNNAETTPVHNGVGFTQSQGALRKANGCRDTNNNHQDFEVVTTGSGLVPRTSATPAHRCAGTAGGAAGPSTMHVRVQPDFLPRRP